MNPGKSKNPEDLGIPSERLLDFLLYLEERKLCIHNIMILRHGEIAFEAHYPPFTAHTLHRMYSVTKSFVSMAIGFLIDEGKITLQSRIADFFPEYVSESTHSRVRQMTVRDLLLMATPYDNTTYTVNDPNWIKTFFTAEPTHKSGTVFNYDTSGTVALNALAEKITGQNLVDYLKPRLFEPLGFSGDVWCVQRPEGGAWGGSGLECSTTDLAKFGLFLLNRGQWQGKQLLSASWLAEACSPLIDNRVNNSNPEFQFGYGYQIWQTRHGFCAYGMGTQLAVCVPDKDLVLAVNGDTQSVAAGPDILLYAFWRLVYPYIENGPLPKAEKNLLALNRKLANLEFPSVDGKTSSPEQKNISGKKFVFGDNPMKIKWAVFDFTGDTAVMKYENSSGVHEINFGLGKYTDGVFPETGYFDKQIGVPGGRGFRYRASGAWFNDHSLTFYLYIIDSCFGTLKTNCYFENNSLTLQMSKAAEWFLDEYNGMATGT